MTTLAQLKTSVDSWLARDDVAVAGTDFPQVLLIAESNISRDFRLAVQEASADLVFTGQSANLPADFLEMRNPFLDDKVRRSEYMTPDQLRESSLWQNGRAGAFYTLEGNNASPLIAGIVSQMTIAAPASVTAPITFRINYWARFPALAANPDTNWLLANHYDVYLYATLRAAAELIQEFELEDRYQSKYLDVVERQNKHENRKRYGAMPKQAYGNPRGVV